jgi:hypothetical protein
MNRKYFVANAALGTAAIVASAIARAPVYLSAGLLPTLATAAVLITWPRSAQSHTYNFASPSQAYVWVCKQRLVVFADQYGGG